MKSAVALAALGAILVLLPPAAAAQDVSGRGDTDLRMERTRKRPLVRPDLPLAQASEDVEHAIDDLDARRVAEHAVRPPRSPQLDHDVTTAIQSRNLQRARGR